MWALTAAAAALGYPAPIAVSGIETGPGSSNRTTLYEVSMPGVPGALALGTKLPDGLYDTYSLTLSNRAVANCGCSGYPQWVASGAVGAAVGAKYRAQLTAAAPVSCDLVMMGHGWTPDAIGLGIPPNAPTAPITIQTKRVADTVAGASPRSAFTPTAADVAAMQRVCPTSITGPGGLEQHCARFNGIASPAGAACLTHPDALNCCVERVVDNINITFPVEFVVPGADGTAVPCTKTPGTTLACVPRPALATALRCPGVTTKDCAEPGAAATTILYTHRTLEGTPLWLPPMPPDNRVDAVDYYCAIVTPACAPSGAATALGDFGGACSVARAAVATSVYFIDSAEETPYIGMSQRGYPGTCLMPGLFVEGAVHPPSLVELANSSANYCDNAFPGLPASFGFNGAKTSGGLTYCANDPLTHSERLALCGAGGTELLVGFKPVSPRELDDACPPRTRTCLVVPGDRFATVQSLIDAGADLTNKTVFLSPVPVAVLDLLVFEVLFLCPTASRCPAAMLSVPSVLGAPRWWTWVPGGG